MQCRSCGESLDGIEHRMVAEWPFCLPCFERLMTSPEPELPAETPRVATAEAAAPIEPPAADDESTRRCSLCNAEIDPEEREPAGLGPWLFCQRCAAARLGPVGEVAPERAEESDPEEEAAPAPALLARRPIACDGCGRQVPAGGTKAIDDAAYCPECFIKHVAEAAAETGSSPGSSPGARACHACGTSATPADLAAVEGFLLCSACRVADEALAVKVARARHRRLLQRLERELG